MCVHFLKSLSWIFWQLAASAPALPASPCTSCLSWLLPVAMINTMTKATPGRRGFLWLTLQVTVHPWRKSGQNTSENLSRSHRRGTLLMELSVDQVGLRFGWSACLRLTNAGIEGVHHNTQLTKAVLKLKFSFQVTLVCIKLTTETNQGSVIAMAWICVPYSSWIRAGCYTICQCSQHPVDWGQRILNSSQPNEESKTLSQKNQTPKTPHLNKTVSWPRLC